VWLVSEATSSVAGVRVLTVDDHVSFRMAARDLVEATNGFVHVGEAATAEEGLVAVDRLRPDVVLMDVRLPGMDGREASRRLAVTNPEIMIILVSASEDPLGGLPVDSCGAAAIVGKQELRPTLLRELWDSFDHQR
jgi:DNA-binding NarL/FixJ family response regulator